MRRIDLETVCKVGFTLVVVAIFVLVVICAGANNEPGRTETVIETEKVETELREPLQAQIDRLARRVSGNDVELEEVHGKIKEMEGTE